MSAATAEPRLSFGQFVNKVAEVMDWPTLAARAAVEMAEELTHPEGVCTCAWWYWYDQERATWYVARLCGAVRVNITTRPGIHDDGRAEAMAAAKCHRLNRIYGFPDPRDNPGARE